MSNIYETMLTPYADSVGDVPWNVYPRPQFKRDSFICLNGKWDFRTSRLDDIPSTYYDKILVPFPPQSRLSGIERRIDKGEILYYKRSFRLPDDFIRGCVILHFGAADCHTEVFINGVSVGCHSGGYLPFSFDITNALSDGENEICVKVKDGNDTRYPYGKQKEKRGGMWYTPVSGIWQTVWLESLPKNYIRGIRIECDTESAVITVDADGMKKLTLKEGGKVYEFEGNKLKITPENPKTWQPEAPFLYEFTLECGEDRIESYFALRKIGVISENGIARLALNGKPYLFSGLLDQGYFPDGIFLPATPDGYRDDILNAKKLGFNMLRKHIKIEPMIFYYLCDTLGIAVFQDMVNNGSYSFFFDTALPTIGVKKLPEFRNRNPKTRKIFKDHMIETASLLYNTPSVLEYTIFNEGWGQFDADEMYKILKDFDSSRVLDATSGWFEGKLTDFNSKHIYFRAPEIKSINDKPLFLSEFGGFSLRIEGHLFGKKNYGYKLYANKDSFTDAVCQLYEKGVLPLIDKGLSAIVYTQLSDVEDETNGLITYDRRVIKINPEIMNALNERLYSRLEDILAK